MFTNTYLPHVGGVARSVHFFAEDLRKMGNKVLIIAPTFPDKEHSLDEKGHVLRVPAIQNFNGSDFSVHIPVPFIIDERLDEFRPDLVHSHHPFLLGDSAIRTAYRRDLPLVFTHHTLYEEYTHYVSTDSPMMRRLAINLSTEYANLCTCIVTPSESIASLIKKRGVTRPIEVIPTGVDIDLFQAGDGAAFRRDNGIPPDAKVIGHLGRLAPEKNLEYLGDSMIHALHEMDRKTYFLVVGSGPSEPLMTEKFREANLENRLIMAGKKKGSELTDAYAAMDLFVFSSKSETQGMVLVEAMAAALPVIALDASGVREVVNDNVNGRLLPADTSPRIFAESIISFFSQDNTAQSWRQEALRTARRFSREDMARKLFDLYLFLQKEQQLLAATTDTEALDPLEELIKSIRIEWDILTEKTNALLHAVRDEIPE
jgi:glycosyltransferase involved in cell wall biosynthesis